MMFCSSSLMGGIGAFARFIDAPGDFISFWRNFAGLIALSIIFLFIGGFKKLKMTRFSGTMLLSGIFLELLSGLYCLSTQYTTLANASFLIYTGPIYSTILAAIFLKEKINFKGICCIIAVVIAFYLLTFATKRLKAGELAAISYQETIMASLLGLIMFGEVMTTFQLIGGALIIIGGVAQIFFSTKAANENADNAEAGAAVLAQVGAGGAGFIDPTPDGMDPKLEAMAEATQEAADDYDSKHPKE